MDRKMMMQGFFDAYKRADDKGLRQLCTADFFFAGRSPEPIDLDSLVAISAAMKCAFEPRISRFRDLTPKGDSIFFLKQFEGKHIGELVVPGHAPFPASCKTVRSPWEPYEIRFRGDQVCALLVEQAPGGALPEILEKPTADKHD